MKNEKFGDGPNTVSESTVSNTKLSEFLCPHRVPEGELSEFLSAYYYLCAKANSPRFAQNSPSLPQNSVRLSEFLSPKQYSRNSIPQGRILAVWILAPKLPNSDLKIAVDFGVDFFLLVFWPGKSTKKSPAKFTPEFVQKNSPRISADAFS